MKIYQAAGKGILDVVKEMIINGTDPSEFGNSAIKTAASNGHLEVVKFLLSDSRVDPAVDDNYPIRRASQGGFANVVKILLEDERIDPCAKDNFAIKKACVCNHFEVVKILLEDGRVDPCAENNYSLKLACYYGHLNIVKLLLENGNVDPNAGNGYCIGAASENGHLEIVKILLNYDCIDPTNRNNKALKLATKNGHSEISGLLKAKIEGQEIEKYYFEINWKYKAFEIDQQVFRFINSNNCCSYNDLKSFLISNKFPFNSRWIFYFLGKKNQLSENEIHFMMNSEVDCFGGYIYGEVYFWEYYFDETTEKRQIVQEFKNQGLTINDINEEDLHKLYVEKGYNQMESFLESVRESAAFNLERKFWDVQDAIPIRESDNDYCEACQESPCMCSDREKTSSTHDF